MRRDRGLSLIELIVAMSIFALVAVMGVQAITGQLFVRDRVLQKDRETAALAMALSILRADMSSVVPVAFTAPDGQVRSVVSVASDDTVVEIAMTIGGQASAEDPRPLAMHRAIWRWNSVTGDLHRAYWPNLSPSPRAVPQGEVRLLAGVRDLELRRFARGQGWQPLYPGPEGVDLSTGVNLDTPDGLVLVLEADTEGRIEILEALE